MSDGKYETTDLGLAAFLSARGHRIVGIGGVPTRRTFTFERSAELTTDALAWFNNQAVKISARALVNGMRDLRTAAAIY